MSTEKLISLSELCAQYEVEMSFFTKMDEFGWIEITTIEATHYVHADRTSSIEKIIRMHHELEINFEGIDTIFNLLDKIETLQSELMETQNRLRIYEG